MSARPEVFLVVVNPAAGGGRAGEAIELVRDAFRESGARFELVTTRGPSDATTLVREALGAGLSGAVAVGGDGTLSEVVNGFFRGEAGELVSERAWLGVVPAGTGRDFARTLGLGPDTRANVTRIVWAKPRPLDVGWVRYRTPDGGHDARAFINVASVGIAGRVDALVNEGLGARLGASAYFVGALSAVASHRLRQVRIRLDGGPSREAAIANLALANGRFVGGGMRIAPEAREDDGLLDVVGIERLGRRELLALAPHLYAGTLLDRDGVTFARARRVDVDPADWATPLVLDVDGETVGTLPATFEMRRHALKLRA